MISSITAFYTCLVLARIFHFNSLRTHWQLGSTLFDADHWNLFFHKATLCIFYGQQIPTGLFFPRRREKIKSKISLPVDVGVWWRNMTWVGYYTGRYPVIPCLLSSLHHQKTQTKGMEWCGSAQWLEQLYSTSIQCIQIINTPLCNDMCPDHWWTVSLVSLLEIHHIN